MFRVILILIMFALTACCTKRVVYEERTTAIPAPDAINVNTATVAELDKLPHVGRKTTESIVQFRNENGPFRRPEILMEIHGISEKRFLEIRQYVRTE
jgi:competence ComEA-like helix-hairpin-helix protein